MSRAQVVRIAAIPAVLAFAVSGRAHDGDPCGSIRLANVAPDTPGLHPEELLTGVQSLGRSSNAVRLTPTPREKAR